ncbi:hypothetical protein B566_EDAN006194 [Ephemera danica]|nr:hypothetical protein B566_EDAN006194 [Ephemera danica]
MDQIFHEKQEGSLCAQHCLNALLQGPYFTAVDLGMLAQSLDDEERIRMAESGIESAEYQRFLAQPSENMDDSGYFSVQVISRALQVWALDIIPYTSTSDLAVTAQRAPDWDISVRGNLPDCRADLALTLKPYVPAKEPQSTATETITVSDDEEDIKTALALSLAEEIPKPLRRELSSEEEELQAALALSLGVQAAQQEPSDEEDQLSAALALSLEMSGPSTTSSETCPVDPEEVRRKRLAFLDSTKST